MPLITLLNASVKVLIVVSLVLLGDSSIWFSGGPLSLPVTFDYLALFLRAISKGVDKVAMPLTILPLAFNDNSILADVSASAVLFSILPPALVDPAIITDTDAFTVWCLTVSEDVADVLAVVAIDLDVWFDEPLEVFGQD